MTDYKNNPPIGSARGLSGRDRKKNYKLNLPPPTDHVREGLI